MDKNRKLRIALIGCGGMSSVHAGALLKDERVEITRLVDTSPQSLKNFKSGHPMAPSKSIRPPQGQGGCTVVSFSR